VSFVKSIDSDRSAFLFGTNIDQKEWYEPLLCVTITIGKRGGIKSIRKQKS
jgi:hypothetical protein